MSAVDQWRERLLGQDAIEARLSLTAVGVLGITLRGITLSV